MSPPSRVVANADKTAATRPKKWNWPNRFQTNKPDQDYTRYIAVRTVENINAFADRDEICRLDNATRIVFFFVAQ